MAPADIVKEVTNSGLRGRGGAGFPTGIKWKTVLDTTGDQKYIVCNADEGDSGTFADRMIMEGDPFVLIEGMAIAGIAVGATKGYIYIRSEYPHAAATMNEAIAMARPRRRAGQQRARLGACLRHGGARRRRRLCLRRGDLAARIAGGQARPGARQAAAAGAQGPVRQADGHQQRDLAGLGADHPRQGRRLLQGFRHGPLARHDPDPDRRQRQAWRAVRGGVRPDARRDRRRHRRRHGERPAGEGGAGRRAARRLFPARAVRHAVRLRGVRRQGRADRPCRHRRLRRHRRHAEAGALRHGILRDRKLRQVHALPHRLDARRGGGRQDRQKHRAAKADRARHRPLQHDEIRIALRARGFYPLSGDERADPFPGRFPAHRPSSKPRNRSGQP